MRKYLAVTNLSDVIVSTASAKRALEQLGEGYDKCMLYDHNGWWISHAARDKHTNKVKLKNTFPDGLPRKHYAEVIKAHPIGSMWDDCLITLKQ